MANRLSRQSSPRNPGINNLALAHALPFAGAALLESTRMTHRIDRSTNARGVTFVLSGEMDGDHVTELAALMAAVSNRPVFLDLADVTLVGREAMAFLARVEAAGAVLVNCPEYVRRWIDAEQGGA